MERALSHRNRIGSDRGSSRLGSGTYITVRIREGGLVSVLAVQEVGVIQVHRWRWSWYSINGIIGGVSITVGVGVIRLKIGGVRSGYMVGG